MRTPSVKGAQVCVKGVARFQSVSYRLDVQARAGHRLTNKNRHTWNRFAWGSQESMVNHQTNCLTSWNEIRQHQRNRKFRFRSSERVKSKVATVFRVEVVSFKLFAHSYAPLYVAHKQL